jgi:hypothetical protein
MDSIPLETAERLCAEIRAENQKKRFSPAAMQCLGCMTYSKGDPAKMCLGSRDGCNLVRKRWEHLGRID